MELGHGQEQAEEHLLQLPVFGQEKLVGNTEGVLAHQVQLLGQGEGAATDPPQVELDLVE